MELVEAPLNSLENGIKVRRKLLDALHDDAHSWTGKNRRKRHCARSRTSPAPDPWKQIESASTRERAIYLPYTFIEGGAGFNSILFRYARLLLRGADERAKPNTERLREFTDSMLPRIEQQLYARVPIYAEVETLTLSFSLQRMREWLGPDSPAWCAASSRRNLPRRSRCGWWRSRNSTTPRFACSCGAAARPRWISRGIR